MAITNIVYTLVFKWKRDLKIKQVYSMYVSVCKSYFIFNKGI